jgi:hypothetical protein
MCERQFGSYQAFRPEMGAARRIVDDKRSATILKRSIWLIQLVNAFRLVKILASKSLILKTFKCRRPAPLVEPRLRLLDVRLSAGLAIGRQVERSYKMSYMAKASVPVRELQRNLERVTTRVGRLETVEVTRSRPLADWPQLETRIRSVFGDRIVVPSALSSTNAASGDDLRRFERVDARFTRPSASRRLQGARSRRLGRSNVIAFKLPGSQTEACSHQDRSRSSPASATACLPAARPA